MMSDMAYGAIALTVMLDSYALVALVLHALGIKRWRDNTPLIVPATVLLGMSGLLVALKAIGMMVRMALIG